MLQMPGVDKHCSYTATEQFENLFNSQKLSILPFLYYKSRII